MGVRLEVMLDNNLDFSTEEGFITHRPIGVYNFDDEFSEDELAKIKRLIEDSVLEQSLFDRPILDMLSKIQNPRDYHVLEISPKKGVVDPWGRETKKVIEQMLDREIGTVSYSRQMLYRGQLDDDKRAGIQKEIQANPLIFEMNDVRGDQWDDQEGIGFNNPTVEAVDTDPFEYIDLDISDEALLEISQKRQLALSLEEMQTIRDLFKAPQYADYRKARVEKGLEANLVTDAELESLAQTWSEHCVHKKFNGRWTYTSTDENDESGIQPVTRSVFKTIIKGSTERIAERIKEGDDYLVSLFSDNAGVVRLTWEVHDSPDQIIYNVAHKVETHNHPSGLDPYGGANTGSGGVFRDPTSTGIGMRCVSSQYAFRVPEPWLFKDLPPSILPPWFILDGVIAGVEDYGNKMGIPTILGNVMMDKGWLKPAVYVGAVAVAPAEINDRKTHEKKVEDGYIAISLGGGVGKDGIHGATMSSLEQFTDDITEGGLNQDVQIGNPIEEKGVFDVQEILRDKGYVEAAQDCGAGGWTSAVGELGEESKGVVMDLTNAPVKYQGLKTWEKGISEAQERDVIVIKAEDLDEVMGICDHYGVQAAEIATFNNSGFYEVIDQDKQAVFLPMDFLHQGLPEMEIKAEWKPFEGKEPSSPYTTDIRSSWGQLLSRPNLQNYHDISKRYDRQVQGGTLVDCIAGTGEGTNDAIAYNPILSEKEVIIESWGSNPWQGDIDAYDMGKNNVVDALGRTIALGGDLRRVTFNDNTTTPNPEKDSLVAAKVIRMLKGAADATEYFDTPIISGKDSTSMIKDYISTETDERVVAAAKPELLMSSMGIMPDDTTLVTSDFKLGGDLIYIVGETKDELGASEFYAMHDEIGANVPKSDFAEIKCNFEAMIQATSEGLVHSAQYLTKGGLAKGLSNCAIGGDLGYDIDLNHIADNTDDPSKLLYSESTGRFVVTIHASQKEKFEEAMGNTYHKEIGTVKNDQDIIITYNGGNNRMRSSVGADRKISKGKIDTNNLKEWSK
tara:strand:- start:7521 stop:10562 length:3042 start_codon:yes stop_codon:yes gene_type:complete